VEMDKGSSEGKDACVGQGGGVHGCAGEGTGGGEGRWKGN